MLFLKILNLGAIFFICFYIGIYKAKMCQERVYELQKFLNGIILFKNKVEFTYEPINYIFSDISNVIYENGENIFKEIKNNNDDINISWIKSVERIKNINNEDKEIIKMFGKLLGKTDIKGQLSQIELTQKLIEKQIEKAEFEKNKNSKLYKTIGIISGIAICIILV